jgi:hypothetical protein
MKRIYLISAFLTCLAIGNIYCQSNSACISCDLEGMFRRVRENLSPKDKLLINDSIQSIIEKYASSDSVFRHKFTNLRFLGQISSPDSLVKIITWNLILEDGGNRYFCYFIRRPKTGEKSTLYKLTGTYNEAPIRTDTIYSKSNWYGALYYDIRPFTTGMVTTYILLGIDYGNSFITRKLIDVLTFGSDGTLIFGKRCFSDDNSIKSRVVFEFAAKVVMSLRFNSDRSIVFDHLSPSSPEYINNHQFWGPDFTFDSYAFENGLWRLKSNIDVRIEKNR